MTASLRAALDSLYCRAMRALRSIRRRVAPVTRREVGGVAIRLSLSSENEHYRAETYATKEPETIAWLGEELRDGDVFFDVGANVGLYALFAAKLRPSCRVYAFEPESHNFSALCRNTLLNAAANLTPCAFPLSDREGFALFHVYALEPGSSLHSLGEASPFRAGEPALREGVLSTTLDELVWRHGLPVPALLKIDVDGLEEKILDGAERILATGSLRSILVEVTRPAPTGDSWAQRKLAPHGFTLVCTSEWATEVNGQRSQNYIFRRDAGETNPSPHRIRHEEAAR